MGRSRIKTGTTYFVATPNGKLRQLNPFLLILTGLVLIVLFAFLAKQSYAFNQRLGTEKQMYRNELASLDESKKQLKEDLEICERKKEDISNLLYFTTEPGKIADEEQ
ncbi:MAG: hypothetical protein U9P14_03430 [Gemmatimonadota bacterium]|nr:hypothetical protein [Gemmatimonadota bacterium]